MRSINMEEDMPEKTDDESERELSEISKIIEKSDIEEDDKERIIGIMQKEVFKGPIPHPRILRQYEEVQSGLASEIVGMAIKEQNHRHDLEKALVQSEVSLNAGQIEVVRASIKLKTRLQIFGFVMTALLVILGAVCIFLDKSAGSVTSFILAVGSFCWTMFYGKSSKDDGENVNE